MSRVRIFGGGVLSALTALAMACANGASTETGDDDAAAPDDGGGRDVFVQPKDVGVQDSPAPPDDGGDCSGKVLVNELEPDGTNGAEFIELFNPGPCAIPLDGWHIEYRSAADNQGPPLHAFQTGDSILSKAYYVLANSKFTGKSDVTITGGMGNTGGQIALTDGAGKVVDAVGYGTITGGKTFTEGSSAPVPATGKSLARTPDGTDTDDNSKDFKVATPSPGVAN